MRLPLGARVLMKGIILFNPITKEIFIYIRILNFATTLKLTLAQWKLPLRSFII
ncbi:hypothetical protein JCM17380_40130 [Desulfosporosinus burensis]